MDQYSKNSIDSLLNQLENLAEIEATKKRTEELKLMLQPVPAFPKSQMTDDAKQKRIEKSRKDFWYFDKVYFPEEIYEDYARPGMFHKSLVKISDSKDKKAHIVHGPRGHGKTITMKKKFIYNFVFGKRRFMAVGSQILGVPQAFILDMIYSLTSNERLVNDYELEWLEKSTEKLFARSVVNPKGTFVTALSEERSSKGAQRMMERLDYVYITDFENLTVSLTKEAIEKRIERLNEMRTSLSDDGTLMWEGNNFDIDCAMNQLLKEHDKGLLSENFEFHLFQAWDKSRPGKQRSLWYSKYPANSEEELKKLCKPKDKYDWAGNFQGRPKKKSGDIFPDTYYNEWDKLPDDVQAVIWTDPNTSEKGKGDTTAITSFGFSPSTQLFYVTGARCKSYFHSNELLTDILRLQSQEANRGVDIITLGMDGNVTQESNWKNNISNYVLIHKVPYPTVLFRKYKVDSLATNLESLWKESKILFPPGFGKSEEGEEFLKQFFGFRLKKAGKKDDAPDSTISGYTLLVELGIAYILTDDPIMIALSTRRVKRI